MVKTEILGPEEFQACLIEAMKWYGVYKAGFDQKDLLPTGAYLAKLLLKKARARKKDGVWVCTNGLKRGRGRIRVKDEIKKIAEVEPYECMVDIYCCIGRKDPYRPLLTMECEGCAGYSSEVRKSATEGDLHECGASLLCGVAADYRADDSRCRCGEAG